MAEHYYELIVNPHRGEVLAPLHADDIIYLKSPSPIEIMPDESRSFSIRGTRPTLTEITRDEYEIRQARSKEFAGHIRRAG